MDVVDLHEKRFADLRARLPEEPGTFEFDQPVPLKATDDE